MLRTVTVSRQRWPLSTPFRISRGVKTEALTVEVAIAQDGHVGRGEGVPYARYGETVDSVAAQIEAASGPLAAGADRADLPALLAAGAARNAVDCALWSLQAARSGGTVAQLLGRDPPPPVVTALTVSLDAPAAMAAAAARIAHAPLLKVKVDAAAPAAQIQAVRRAAPKARLIVDPNESWSIDLLRELLPLMAQLKVDLVEQPLPAGGDEALAGLRPPVPICADESCHVAADLPRLVGRYQAVNIKLDKTGGLTEALALLAAARQARFSVMVGCMICSSLSVAPALHVARHADFVDLDGPLWLARDQPGAIVSVDGVLQPPVAALWDAP